jgi:predicted phosphoribosyltransferase
MNRVIELLELRDRTHVFADRADAGTVLAGMLEFLRNSDALLLAIPAGGVPVAAPIATRLGLALDVAVVSKITLPWTSEAGYGAVGFDGAVRLNDELLSHLGLKEAEIRDGVARTQRKVAQRLAALRGSRLLPVFSGRTVVLVDDGLASGITMRVAIDAVRKAGGDHIVIAIPTGHLDSFQKFDGLAEAIYCPNVRGGYRFAVADAYRDWSDVDEAQLQEMLREFMPPDAR